MKTTRTVSLKKTISRNIRRNRKGKINITLRTGEGKQSTDRPKVRRKKKCAILLKFRRGRNVLLVEVQWPSSCWTNV